ncbi:heme-binding protein [Paenibacillus alginolyticus]|uniref:Heme-binding protein n=1 Tax=Paenibacillus alginolyticus TaxID=59839 RepID=A0ABT4G9E9_9BACL|nr:heme-binding protein [Paenibacillus alginolyticus]MCY9669714.1 heme-binding protein [Paenibacillus alginolyticus]MCY9692787.1 heme-binding protein [Paenibacillus alginolyticus]MEC0146108.1 heme-binding protein [Paenibacillus alginolyticus]
MLKITLEVAKVLIHAAELRARDLGIAEVIAIVDDGGNFVASHRMDHAWLASVDIAHNKAWTAVALKMPTASLAPLAVPSGELYGINTTNHGRVVVFGGGIPLSFEGRIVGAVGASGSTVANDIEVAKAAVRAFETYPKARIGSSGSLL